MKGYHRPKAGQEFPLIESAAFWADIIDMLNAYQSGKLTGTTQRRGNSGGISVINTSGTDREHGELLQIDAMEAVPSGLAEALLGAPVVNAVTPVWHTAIDNLIAVQGGAPKDAGINWRSNPWAIVELTGSTSTDRYVMVDPVTPTKMKTADAGIWRIIGLDSTNDYAVVDLTSSQPMWRYELTADSSAPSVTTAKLMTLGGSEFAASINLSDPLSLMDDQVIGDGGFCVHVGNEFHAIQGPCS